MTLKKLSFGLSAIMATFLLFQGIQGTEAKADQTGTIEGVVKTPWVKRYPALVYIEHVSGDFPPPKENVHVSQTGLVFTPHILPVLKGTTVDFTNDDNVVHNVFSPPGAAVRFNTGNYGAGVVKTQTFDQLGEVPLLCSVHPDMLAYVLVLQNPFHGLTDSSGNFKIQNVPGGAYRLKVWNEKLQEASQEVTVKAGETVRVSFENLRKR